MRNFLTREVPLGKISPTVSTKIQPYAVSAEGVSTGLGDFSLGYILREFLPKDDWLRSCEGKALERI